MLVKGDKIRLVKEIKNAPLQVGEICEIVDVTENGIAFRFGEYHLGMCSAKEYEEYFEKVVKETSAPKVEEDRINWIVENMKLDVNTTFDKCTVVSAKLPNGFVITESSASVSPENYNQSVGIDICIDKIVNKIWELEGYLLQESINPTEVLLEEDEDWDDRGCPEECIADCDECPLVDELVGEYNDSLCDEDCSNCDICEYHAGYCDNCPMSEEEDFEEDECKHSWMIIGLSNDGLMDIVCNKCGEEREVELDFGKIK